MLISITLRHAARMRYAVCAISADYALMPFSPMMLIFASSATLLIDAALIFSYAARRLISAFTCHDC